MEAIIMKLEKVNDTKQYRMYQVSIKEDLKIVNINVFFNQEPNALDTNTIIDIEPNGKYYNYIGICKDQVSFDTPVVSSTEDKYYFGMAVKAAYCYCANKEAIVSLKPSFVKEHIKNWFDIIKQSAKELL